MMSLYFYSLDNPEAKNEFSLDILLNYHKRGDV